LQHDKVGQFQQEGVIASNLPKFADKREEKNKGEEKGKLLPPTFYNLFLIIPKLCLSLRSMDNLI